MTQYIIDTGAAPDDGQGDPLRTAFTYTNQNFDQIFAAGPVLSNIQIGNTTITTTILNSNLILSPSGIGRIQLNNTLFPRLGDVYDIGTPSLRFNSIYLGTGGIDTTGGITTTGNVTAGYFIGNGSQLTGIVATTGSQVVNGNSNLDIPSAGSNIFVTVNGTSNVVTFASTGVYVAGTVSATGNIAGNYILGNGALLTGINIGYGNSNVAAFLPTYTGNLVSLTGPVTTTANVTGGNLRTAGQISATGNITGGNINTGRLNAGYITTGTTISAIGNITTSAYFIGDGSQLTNLPAGNYSNANVAAFLPTYTGNLVSLTGPVTTTSNITGGNLRTTGQISATGNIIGGNVDTGRLDADSVTVTGPITATGNITGGNLIGTSVVATVVSATANVTGGNIITSGLISATGNIQAGNLNVPVGTVTAGTVSASGNVRGGNLITSGQISATGNLVAGNVDTTRLDADYITVGGYVSAIGNVYGNNFIGSSLSVTGNVSAGNVAITGTFGAASLSAAGNITGGNLITSGNVIGSYFVGNGSLLTGITVSAGTSILNGNSNVAVAANGNVTISSAGVSNVVTVSDTGAYVVGVVSATGNVTGTYLLGNGAFITGLPAGYSNADVANYLPTYSGNLPNLTGLVSTTGNIAGNYFIGNGSLLTGITASAVNAAALVGNTLSSNVLYSSLTSVGNLSNLSVTGNAAVGNVLTGGIVSATGNVTGNYILGNGALLTGVITSVANINNGTSNVTVVSSGGNITVGVGGTANVAVFATSGEYITGILSASGNIVGGNILTGGLISSTANIVGGNINTAGQISAAGNISGSYFIGNGSQLTGVSASSVNANALIGNTLSSNVLYSSLTQVGNLANLSVIGNTVSGNLLTGGLISSTGTVTASSLLGSVISASGNVTGGNISTANLVSTKDFSITGNITGNLIPSANITYNIGTATNAFKDLYLSGNSIYLGAQIISSNATSISTGTGNLAGNNVNAANAVTAGTTISAVGNVIGGNVLTAGLISATGNATAGNILTGGLVSATANITGGNLQTAGSITATGNATVGNLLTGGLISATGNITGGNLSIVGGTLAFANASIVQTNPLDLGITGAYQISVKPAGGSYQWTFGNDGSLTGPTGVGTTGYLSAVGNVTGNNVFATGFASVTGNVIAGNVNTSGIRPTSGALTITTASGNLNLQPAGNIVLANTFINSVAYPAQDTDAATKLYVDNMVSSALSFHSPAYAATTTTLAITTGGTITYAQPNGVSNGIGAYLSTTGSFNLIDTANVQTAGTRILVKNEGNAVYNGVYTWSNATVIVRSTDADEYGPDSVNQLSLNDYFFTTNGNVNAGSAFVVNAPTGTITFGTSNISFALFSQATTYTANVDAGLSLIGTQFNAKVDQNTTAFDVTGNIIVKAGANLTTPNIGAATGTSLSVTGNVNSGNVTTSGLISATGNVTGGNVLTAGLISATGNATLGNILTGGSISSTGNITGGNLITSGILSATGNIISVANISGGNILTSGLVSATSNVTGGNLTTSGLISSTGNITGGNLLTSGLISSTGNATLGNVLTGGLVSATANITGGNVLTAGVVSATGNVSGNYFLGNGSQLTGIIASGGQGNTITLGTPSDGSLTANGAYQGWTTGTFVTDGLDDLNQVAFNIANSTYVGNTYITANVYSGPSPLTVAFTGRYIGNPNSFLWQFGDGTANVTTANATHTFSNALGGTYTVTFTAYNTNGTYNGNAAQGAKGSTSTANISNIVVYTPSPIPSFTLSSNSFNTGNTITITNTSQYVTWYDLSFGDGTANFTAGPGLGNTSFTNVTHQYNSVSSNADSLYSVILSGTSNTAGASNVTVVSSASNVKVYSPQTGNVFLTANAATVINGVGTISFRNDSNGTPGNTASFGAQQLYNFNYGDGNVSNVNVGTGIAGNPSAANLTNTFALSAANQAGNAYQQFTANLYLYTGYSTSPAKSSNITISVNPQVRANYIGTTANVITDATANTGNARVGYLYTDYNNANRSTFTFQNTSQNSNLANWSWGDSTFSNGVSNVGNSLHTYNSTGAFTVALTANGTPNGISSTAQSNTISNVGYIFIATNPTAPTNLSGFSNLAIANTSEGTSPLLAAGARDASGGNIVANGASVTRFATTTTIATAANIINANTGISSSQLTANLFAYVNNANAGNVTFSNVSNTVGTSGALVVTQDRDLHVANAAVPSYFYKVFNANIACALSSLGTGYNNYKLVDSVTGNTNYVGFVKDNLNSSPSLVTANIAMVEATAGTYRYISGIPYYNTGSPTITIANLEVANLSGQTFRSADPFILDSGTVSEGSGAVLSATQTKALSTINNGASSFLTSANLNANVGISSNYILGNLTGNITGANNSVATLQANIFNVIGTSTTVQLPTKIQMYAGANSGINEQSITCTPTANTQAAIRIVMSTAGNTPVFANSINYYTSNAWSGAQTIAGTPEAVVRYGVLQRYAVDLSTGYLPVGPNLSIGGNRTTTQYFTFAFARPSLANFDIRLTTTTGVAGVWVAAPGTTIDSGGFSSPTPGFPGPTSTINGWLEASTQYAGAGVPGAASGTGGNGSNGCALTGADVIPLNTAIANVGYTMTLGGQNAANSTGTNILIRIALASGQSITALSIGVAT